MQEHGATTTVEFPSPAQTIPSGWLEEARAALPSQGRYLVARGEDAIQVFSVGAGWTRIGRSVAADIRLDHPSVSRRHALIVSESDTTLRVLDDRSLNGVFVNGEEIEWGKLEDGDELRIGRFQLFVLEV
jgi:pSer/pThr/pTyr-binding forkhead associated (FHA) protein